MAQPADVLQPEPFAATPTPAASPSPAQSSAPSSSPAAHKFGPISLPAKPQLPNVTAIAAGVRASLTEAVRDAIMWKVAVRPQLCKDTHKPVVRCMEGSCAALKPCNASQVCVQECGSCSRHKCVDFALPVHVPKLPPLPHLPAFPQLPHFFNKTSFFKVRMQAGELLFDQPLLAFVVKQPTTCRHHQRPPTQALLISNPLLNPINSPPVPTTRPWTSRPP